MKQRRPENRTALTIKSEMTSAEQSVITRHVVGFRRLESIRLREYHDSNMTSDEMIVWFLQDVDQATRADIAGATMLSWAVVDRVIQELEQKRQLRRFTTCDPEEYAWKR